MSRILIPLLIWVGVMLLGLPAPRATAQVMSVASPHQETAPLAAQVMLRASTLRNDLAGAPSVRPMPLGIRTLLET